MTQARYQDRLVWQQLSMQDSANPVTVAVYFFGHLASNNAFIPTNPRACKLVGYSVTTITNGDTTPGNWTVSFQSSAGTVTFSVNVTTTLTVQTHATVPWSSNLIMQAGTQWIAFATGPSKNGIGSFLTLEFEII